MIYVGIDISKDKHDCFIVNSDGEVLFDVFTIQNNMDGFEDLLFKIKTCEKNADKVKVGLEATGHYSCNLLGFLKNLYPHYMETLFTNYYQNFQVLSILHRQTSNILRTYLTPHQRVG